MIQGGDFTRRVAQRVAQRSASFRLCGAMFLRRALPHTESSESFASMSLYAALLAESLSRSPSRVPHLACAGVTAAAGSPFTARSSPMRTSSSGTRSRGSSAWRTPARTPTARGPGLRWDKPGRVLATESNPLGFGAQWFSLSARLRRDGGP